VRDTGGGISIARVVFSGSQSLKFHHEGHEEIRLNSLSVNLGTLVDFLHALHVLHGKKVLVLLVALGESAARLYGRIAGRVLDDSEGGDSAGSEIKKISKLEIRNKSERNFPKTGGIDAR
jgi:hypothetical protein